MAWQVKRSEKAAKRMTSHNFEDYPGSESGDIHEEVPGGRKPFSPIVEEDEDNMEDLSRRQKSNMEGVVGGVVTGRRRNSSPRSSTSPKHQSLSPSSHSSSSGHSSPHSPPTHPPPPTAQPPPLPPSSQAHRYNPHPAAIPSGPLPHMPPKLKNIQRPGGSKKPYEKHVVPYGGYGTHQSDPYTGGRGVISKPLPQYPQARVTEVVLDSKVFPSKKYPMAIDQEGAVPPESLAMKPEHLELDIRGCPSGASSPSSTPNNTLIKSSRGHTHYDPLAASASESKLKNSMGGGGGESVSKNPHQVPQDGAMETHSDSNLLNYYQNEGGGVVTSRTFAGQGGVVGKKPPQKMQGALGIKDNIREWESKGGTKNGNESSSQEGYMSGGGTLAGRVLHPPVSTSAKDRGRGDMGSISNGPSSSYGGSGSKSSVSPENAAVVRPSSWDSGYDPSSSSAHSLSPSQGNHTSLPEEQSRHSTSTAGTGEKSSTSLGGVSPSSSTEELMKINEVSEEDEATDGVSHTNHNVIIKPEPTKSTSKLNPSNYPTPPKGIVSTAYPGKQVPPPPPPPPSYRHPMTSSSEQTHPPPAYPHSASLSQPMPSQQVVHLNPSNPLSLSQGQYYLPKGQHQNVPPSGGGPYGGGRYPGPYENVPVVYETLHSTAVQGHSHLPHPQASQGGPPPPKYGGGSQQQQGQPSYMGDPHVMPPPHMRGLPSYGVGAGSRRKPINPASVSVAHDAAASGDIATLHHMLSNHEIDAFTFNEHRFTLAHKAALHGQLALLNYLIDDAGLPLIALQLPDDSLSTPAMLVIQGGHVECLQWMVEQCKVPLEVRDTGGETLAHHAAYHGQVKCLEWLLKAIKKKEEQHKEILDESGVTPAHFAAQGGHLDCLQLLIDHQYSVVHADQEGQKPLDWADAMNQTVCVRYLMMYEACWALSAEVTHLYEQLSILHKDYEKLRDMLTQQNQDHQHAMGMLQHSHKEKIAKIREQYVDLTATLLKSSSSAAGGSGGGAGGGGSTTGSSSSSSSSSSNKSKSQVSGRNKAPTEPPVSHRHSTKPPLPPDSSKKHSARASQSNEGKDDTFQNGVDYRTVTPQEVMEKQLTTVAHKMTLSRKAREQQRGLAPRNYSPLTPIIQRLYRSKSDEEQGKTTRRHTESHERRVTPKAVKFSNTVTEFPEYSRFEEESRTPAKSSGHKYSGPPGAVNHSNPGRTTGHNSLGQYDFDRTGPDGESGHSKADMIATKKLSSEK